MYHFRKETTDAFECDCEFTDSEVGDTELSGSEVGDTELSESEVESEVETEVEVKVENEVEVESEVESEAESYIESAWNRSKDEIVDQDYAEKNVIRSVSMAIDVQLLNSQYKKEHELQAHLEVWKKHLIDFENLPTSNQNVLDGALTNFCIHYLDTKYAKAFGKETLYAFIQRVCAHKKNIAEKSAALAESISAFEQEKEFRIEEAKKKIQVISSDYHQSRKRNADHLNAMEQRISRGTSRATPY